MSKNKHFYPLLSGKLLKKNRKNCTQRNLVIVSKITLRTKQQVGNVAGSFVEDGVVNKGGSVLVKRRGRIIHEGTLKTLKNVKADVQQMVAGTECGIQVLLTPSPPSRPKPLLYIM